MDNKSIYDLPEIKRRLEPVFAASGVKTAVIFGSYAQGQATEDSDVDILVDSGLRGLDFVGLVEYIREALQKEVDVLDVRYLTPNSPVGQEALPTGVMIYTEQTPKQYELTFPRSLFFRKLKQQLLFIVQTNNIPTFKR